MHIQFVQVLQQGSKRRTLGHLGKGINILWEALTTVAELSVRARDVGVGVIDVAGEEDAGMNLAPVSSHLLTVLTAGVEVGHLVGTKHIVHVLGEFCLQGSHNSELLAHKDLGK